MYRTLREQLKHSYSSNTLYEKNCALLAVRQVILQKALYKKYTRVVPKYSTPLCASNLHNRTHVPRLNQG